MLKKKNFNRYSAVIERNTVYNLNSALFLDITICLEFIFQFRFRSLSVTNSFIAFQLEFSWSAYMYFIIALWRAGLSLLWAVWW